ncbi:MAG: excinuclease ABC subunit UvrC [Candidatus Nanopelagicales bacterium]
MMPPADYRPAPGEIPTDPGVYRFRDRDGRVIYVGKAKSLRARLSSYFQDPAGLHPRTFAMVHSAASVDWVVVGSEIEALTLEYAWIKEYDPRFNVRYRDDKSYPYLAVTLDEEYPRALVMRGEKRKGGRYFGPYTHAWAIRETVDQLLRVFPMRTCTTGVFKRAAAAGRPCLLGYIDKCSAPCVGRVTAAEHRAIAEDFCSFVAGNTTPFLRETEKAMKRAAGDLDFEQAAKLRDDLAALQRALERNTLVLPDRMDADVIGYADDELEASVRVFHVRDGRVRGERGYIVEKVAESSVGTLIEGLITQLYGSADPAEIPKAFLVPELPDEEDSALVTWLAERRGRRVSLTVPQRGDRRSLLETVTRNAEQALALHKIRRSSDLTSRSKALTELAEALDLPVAPLRIECYDVSNLGADDVVASMVVFEDGLPRPSEYRKFAIKGFAGQNDVAAISEVITRRFRRSLAPPPDAPADGSLGASRDGPTGAPKRFAYPPQLVVIDGGPPQVQAAFSAMTELGIVDVAVCGLAKRLEEVWLPEEEDPVILPRSSEGMYLLQRVRDEAHRTALRYQKQKRAARFTKSALDEIPGLGPHRAKALLSRFGSVKGIRAAQPEQLQEVPGVGPRLAAAVAAALGATEAAVAVNLTTGEVIGEDVGVQAGEQ